MTKETRKKRAEILEKIRKSEEKEVNLIPFSPQSSNQFFLGFKLNSDKVNQMWRWDTLEDVKL